MKKYELNTKGGLEHVYGDSFDVDEFGVYIYRRGPEQGYMCDPDTVAFYTSDGFISICEVREDK